MTAMDMHRFLNNRHTDFVLIVIVLTLVFLEISVQWSYFLNPDGFAYLSLATKLLSYSGHNLLDAISGVWSYPFTVIVAILGKVIGTGISTAKDANFLTGILVLYALHHLLIKLKIRRITSLIILVIAASRILWQALTMVSSDLLFDACVLFSIGILLNKDFLSNDYSVITYATVSAAAFYSKQYGLYVFLGFFTLYTLIYLMLHKNQLVPTIKRFLIGILVFAALISPWILLMKIKYGEWTTGYQGKYNLIYGLEYTVDYPLKNLGLQPPPNPSATFVWEDPTYLIPSNIAIKINYTKVLTNIGKNVLYYFNILNSYFPFFYLVIPLAMYIAIKRKNKEKMRYLLIIVAILVLFPTGYLIVFLESRFVFISYILSLLVLAQLLSQLETSKSSVYLKVAVFVATFFILFMPIKKYDAKNLDYPLYTFANNLKQFVPEFSEINKRFASNCNYFPSYDIAYYFSGRYYGVIAPNASTEEVYNQLRENRIDYYLYWLDEGCNKNVATKKGALNFASAFYLIPVDRNIISSK